MLLRPIIEPVASCGRRLGAESARSELSSSKIRNLISILRVNRQRRKLNWEIAVRKLILATVTATILGIPVGQALRAEDTTVIKRDNDGDQSTTVIKKKQDEVNPLPVPHVEEKQKTIIKKENDDD
jgi:hypothetical protein